VLRRLGREYDIFPRWSAKPPSTIPSI
jgi:hypothetical protein